MNRMPFAFTLAKTSPYKDWSEFEKVAKTEQKRVAVDGYGSANDLCTRYFMSKGNLKLIVVPFAKPGERYAALLGGQVDIMCDAIGNVHQYTESGQMHPVVVFSKKRLPNAPSCPTALELSYKVDLEEWRSITVKAGTDSKKVAFLSNALATAYKTQEFQDFLKSTWSDADSYVPGKDLPAYFDARRKDIATLITATSAGR